MAGADDPPDLTEHAADPHEHLLADHGVRLDHCPLLVGELGGLVDDLGGDPDLAHVVQQRHELGVAPAAGVEPELVGDTEAERDDVTAVAAGVGVVRLDDVTQQERRPAIGVRELERVVDASAPLPCEDLEQARERQHEQEGRGLRHRRERGEQPDRRERGVDRPRPAHVPDELARRDAEGEPFAHRDAAEVECELRDQRRHVDGPVAERRRLFAGEREHEHGADRVRRIGQPQEEPLEVEPALDVLDEVGDHDPTCDRRRGRCRAGAGRASGRTRAGSSPRAPSRPRTRSGTRVRRRARALRSSAARVHGPSRRGLRRAR